MVENEYWVYENGYLRGPFKVTELAQRESFAVSMLICRNGDHVWRPVHAIPEIAPLLADAAHAQVLASGDYLPEGLTGKSPPSVVKSDDSDLPNP